MPRPRLEAFSPNLHQVLASFMKQPPTKKKLQESEILLYRSTHPILICFIVVAGPVSTADKIYLFSGTVSKVRCGNSQKRCLYLLRMYIMMYDSFKVTLNPQVHSQFSKLAINVHKQWLFEALIHGSSPGSLPLLPAPLGVRDPFGPSGRRLA